MASDTEIFNDVYDSSSHTLKTSGTSVTPGTGATNLGKAVDSVAGATDTGVAALFVRKDTPATITPADGDYTRGVVDSMGLRWSREYYAPVYEDNTTGVAKVEQRFNYAYISTATTTTVKSGAGFMHTITVNGGTAGTIIFYDNTAGSGTIIASFDSTNALATYTLNVSFSTGLTIVTGAATKVTVSYR